jgi:hypothetical protein
MHWDHKQHWRCRYRRGVVHGILRAALLSARHRASVELGCAPSRVREAFECTKTPVYDVQAEKKANALSKASASSASNLRSTMSVLLSHTDVPVPLASSSVVLLSDNTGPAWAVVRQSAVADPTEMTRLSSQRNAVPVTRANEL